MTGFFGVPEPATDRVGFGVSTMQQIPFEGEARSLALWVAFGIANELYGEALRVRSYGNTKTVFDFDDYSFHYCLRKESIAIGALTVTRYVDGDVDCSHFYPTELFRRYGHQITSGCKLRITPGDHSGLATLRQVLRGVLRHQLSAGMRIDVVNAEQRMAILYEWLGYHRIDGAEFIHPTLGTQSDVLVLPADPTRPSAFQDLFKPLKDPVLLTDILPLFKEGREGSSETWNGDENG